MLGGFPFLPESTMPQSHAEILNHLSKLFESRRPANGGDPASSYVAKLLSKAPDAILKKIGEEATETVMASKDLQAGRADADVLVYEVADLWFHSLVLLAHHGVEAEAVLAELARREGVSGLVEKASRSEG